MNTKLPSSNTKPQQLRTCRKPTRPQHHTIMIESLEDRALCSVAPMMMTPSIPIPPPLIPPSPRILAILIGR
jgi:hypothetical protein